MFEKIGKWFGAGGSVIDQGQEMWGALSEALAGLLDGDITVDDVKRAATTLSTVATGAKEMVAKLPEGELKERVQAGLDEVMEISPKVRDRATPMREMLDPSTDIGAEEWTEALHSQVIGENPDFKLASQVQAAANKLQGS